MREPWLRSWFSESWLFQRKRGSRGPFRSATCPPRPAERQCDRGVWSHRTEETRGLMSPCQRQPGRSLTLLPRQPLRSWQPGCCPPLLCGLDPCPKHLWGPGGTIVTSSGENRLYILQKVLRLGPGGSRPLPSKPPCPPPRPPLCSEPGCFSL